MREATTTNFEVQAYDAIRAAGLTPQQEYTVFLLLVVRQSSIRNKRAWKNGGPRQSLRLLARTRRSGSCRTRNPEGVKDTCEILKQHFSRL
jgi:hypothetical protein